MARAGTVEALDSDYTRTAVLKGLPRRTVVRRHVLRNSLLPTIAVVATQTGYLIGGLVAIELIFNYPGIGRLLFRAADQKDFPLLAEHRARDRDRLPAGDPRRRSRLRVPEPSHPLRDGVPDEHRRRARPDRRPRLRARVAPRAAPACPALEDVSGRSGHRRLLDLLRRLRPGRRSRRPLCRRHPQQAPAAVVRALVRHRQARPRRLLPRHRRRPGHPDRGAARDLARHGARHRTRPDHRLLPRPHDEALMRVVDAFLAIPVVVIGLLALTAARAFDG